MLARLAGGVGLKEQQFRQALQERKYQEAHRAGLRRASDEAGGTAVPAFLIGQAMLTGMQRKETLERVIDAELRKRQAGLLPARHVALKDAPKSGPTSTGSGQHPASGRPRTSANHRGDRSRCRMSKKKNRGSDPGFTPYLTDQTTGFAERFAENLLPKGAEP